jgi:hypothetical protein
MKRQNARVMEVRCLGGGGEGVHCLLSLTMHATCPDQGRWHASPNPHPPTNRTHPHPRQMEMMGTKSVYCRHPDDCAAILKSQARFPKSEVALGRLSDWLGNGLASNTDVTNHAVGACAVVGRCGGAARGLVINVSSDQRRQ